MRILAAAGLHAAQTCGEAEVGALLPVINGILAADCIASVKQRHSAKRIFESLRDEHGFGGGYTVVKDYVRLTVLLRPHADQLVDRYSELRDRDEPVVTQVEKAGLA